MRFLPVTLLAFILYIIITGSMTLYDITTGIITAIAAGLLFGKYLVKNPQKALNPARWVTMVAYFIKYITIIELKAHLDVIKRIISGDTNPGIIRVPITVKDEYAKFLVANSITNTPGTVTVYMDDKYAYVNWIDVKTRDPDAARREILEEFEKHAKRIFEG
ncbi:MAG TPA: cation:proton antiporter [Thermococcus litoralis]|uniref:Cation:proton antiporter n=1 Tax=Thermococcus litoralis TaxID=2265 RepID=A0A7C5K0B5_THELI|nr:cation:proton antiporter [Thermococcus litoralis]